MTRTMIHAPALLYSISLWAQERGGQAPFQMADSVVCRIANKMGAIGLLCSIALCSQNQSSQPAFQMPDSIQSRAVDIYSEGTRISGNLFWDKTNVGKKLPTIVLAHGWGGVQASLRPEAAAFAQAGYLALTFDYRGWGTSDSKVILTEKRMPADVKNWRFNAEVQAVREVVDPNDMTIDWLNAIAFIAGEPQCDVNRIGLWGSSLSGGLVLAAAERDPRVKGVHSQVRHAGMVGC